MVKILNLRNRKKEKGLTLAEVVVAIAIIVIVSAATLSIAVYSSNAFNKASIKNYFVHEINTISKLYLSYDEADFSTAFYDCTGKTISGYTDSTFYLSDSFAFLENESNSAYYMTLTFGEKTLVLGSYYANSTLILERSVSK